MDPAKLTLVRQPFDHPDFLFELNTTAPGPWRTSPTVIANWFPDVEIPTKALENCALIWLG
ncbi:MAG: hypothetical protein QOG55_2475 [Acidobacteriaceae bacterium]|jgi:hypothetical protein|nr:hypothetical protein [Acidobacteriaceae bacterium]